MLCTIYIVEKKTKKKNECVIFEEKTQQTYLSNITKLKNNNVKLYLTI